VEHMKGFLPMCDNQAYKESEQIIRNDQFRSVNLGKTIWSKK
jgi:hypothetical protein